ncbi:PF11737 family protein [Bordetella bronchiseptica OSU553]|nr:PF11737 family protein [Bordetella bronchiseptica OSU553]
MLRLRYLLVSLLYLGAIWAGPAQAQAKLDNARLDQLLAPVALYPDSLLSQVLMAATYPDDVAAAAKWSADHPKDSGDAAVKAAEGQSWDPSVKSLVAFPSVMDLMGRQPQWVKSLGDAFLAQPDDVMDSVQRLRTEARKAGTLTSNKQQKVTTTESAGKTVVVVEPADPQVVYVPSYNPTVVYGAWPYPAYPPYYYPPPPGSAFATALVGGIGFGLGVAAVDAMWGGFDWGHNDVDIDVNRYNNVNINHRIDTSNTRVDWQHNAANRGSAAYADSASRQRFDAQRQAGQQRRAQAGQRAGGGSIDAERQRAAQAFEGHTGHAVAGYGGPGHGGERAGAPGRDARPTGSRPGQAGAGQRQPGQHNPAHADGMQRQRADQAAARERAEQFNRTPALHDAGDGARMRQQTQRGDFAQQRGGFGGRGGTGGGAHHFGHGRR